MISVQDGSGLKHSRKTYLFSCAHSHRGFGEDSLPQPSESKQVPIKAYQEDGDWAKQRMVTWPLEPHLFEINMLWLQVTSFKMPVVISRKGNV